VCRSGDPFESDCTCKVHGSFRYVGSDVGRLVMKPRGRHPNRALTDAFIEAIGIPGRYSDGDGLYLLVSASGAKRWVLRIMAHGRRRDFGLGSLSLVSLEEARRKARDVRKFARDGALGCAAGRFHGLMSAA
jgi:Arm DNA-binding domain